MNCIKIVVMLTSIFGYNALHGFVRQQSYEAWKKKIDGLNQPDARYVPDAPTIIWTNFILIEGSINYSLVHKEAAADLNNKIARAKEFLKRSTDFQSFLENLFNYIQPLAEQQKELERAFNRVKWAEELIDSINTAHTRASHMQKILADGSTPSEVIERSIKELEKQAKEGLTAISRLERFLKDNKQDIYPTPKIQDFNALFESTFFENAKQQAKEMLGE